MFFYILSLIKKGPSGPEISSRGCNDTGTNVSTEMVSGILVFNNLIPLCNDSGVRKTMHFVVKL